MKKYSRPAIFGVLCILLSMVITIQLRVTSSSGSASSVQKRISSLKDQIISLNDENTKLTKKMDETTNALDMARTAASENDLSSAQKSELIKKYNTLLGNTDVYGQGLVIKYTAAKDESKADVSKDLRYIINELKNIEAEAISINGQRIINSTSIEVVKNKINVNNTAIDEPYTIKVIGNSNMIYNGITRPGGIVDVLKASGVKITIDLKDKVEITKFSNI